MSASAHNERPAETLLPGDLIRRENATWRLTRVAVTVATVEAEAERVGVAPGALKSARITGQLRFVSGELVQMVQASLVA